MNTHTHTQQPQEHMQEEYRRYLGSLSIPDQDGGRDVCTKRSRSPAVEHGEHEKSKERKAGKKDAESDADPLSDQSQGAMKERFRESPFENAPSCTTDESTNCHGKRTRPLTCDLRHGRKERRRQVKMFADRKRERINLSFFPPENE